MEAMELLLTIRPFPNLLLLMGSIEKSTAYNYCGNTENQLIVGDAAPISCRDGVFLCQ